MSVDTRPEFIAKVCSKYYTLFSLCIQIAMIVSNVKQEVSRDMYNNNSWQAVCVRKITDIIICILLE
jgi:hypothetical protein